MTQAASPALVNGSYQSTSQLLLLHCILKLDKNIEAMMKEYEHASCLHQACLMLHMLRLDGVKVHPCAH